MSNKKIIVIKNEKTELNRVWEEVQSFCEENQIFKSDQQKVELALDEILINIIKYGYPDKKTHEIEIYLDVIDRETWIIQIIDDGIPFDPTEKTEPASISLDLEDRPLGGLGIFLVKSLFNEVEYHREASQNILKITHRIRSLL